jgi:hypothetical protein
MEDEMDSECSIHEREEEYIQDIGGTNETSRKT